METLKMNIKQEIDNYTFGPVKVESPDITVKQEVPDETVKQEFTSYHPIKNEEQIEFKDEFPSKTNAIGVKHEVKIAAFSNPVPVEHTITRDLFGRCCICKLKRCKCNLPKNEENAKKYQCSKCDFTTKTSLTLKFHFKRRHDLEWKKTVTLFCHHCDYQTSFKNSLGDHIKRNHRWKYETFACPKCPYKTKLKEYLSKHIQRQHDLLDRNNLLKCTQCDYVSKYNHHLMQHIEVKHKNSEPYICVICGHKTKCRQYLQKHMKRIHSDPQKCEYCTYIAASQEHLRFHQKTKHKEIPEVNIPARCKTHKCKHCGYLTDDISQLKDHYSKVHQENYTAKTPKFSKILNCEHCPFTTKYPHDLKCHIKTQHDENHKKIKCPFCPYKKKQKNNVLKHIRMLHGENKMPSKISVKFYSCMYCNFYTRYKDVLKRHLISSKQSFQCKKCNFKTRCQSYLDYHIKNANHIEININNNETKRERPSKNKKAKYFSCVHCGFKTVTKPTLANHLQCTSRAREVIKCDLCHFCTKCKSFFNYHISMRHIKQEDIIIKEENFICQEIIKTEDSVQTESVLVSRDESYIFDTIKSENVDGSVHF